MAKKKKSNEIILEPIENKSLDIKQTEFDLAKAMEERITNFEKKLKSEPEPKIDEKPKLDDIEDFETKLEKDDFQELYDFKQNIEDKLNAAISKATEKIDDLQNQITDEINNLQEEANKIINQAQVFVNSQISKAISDIQDFDFNQQKLDLIDSFTEQINNHLPDNFKVKNIDDINKMRQLIADYVPPKHKPSIGIGGVNINFNPLSFIENKTFTDLFAKLYDDYDSKTNPERNEQLKSRNIIDNNLGMLKDVFNLQEIPTMDEVQQILKLPADFDMNILSDFLKSNTDSIPDFNSLKDKLKLPELEKIENLQQLVGEKVSGVIANLKGFKKPSVSKPTTGLNFDRMSGTIKNAFATDFTEDTDWDQVVKFQAHMITQAVFNELANMKFYIEPGQIKVLTNGSPSTHKGQNTNRITIKLK